MNHRVLGSPKYAKLQRTATKCTKIYKARAQPFFCSLNLLFGDVPVAVAVVVCLSLNRAEEQNKS